MSSRFVEVYRADNLVEAHLLSSRLQEAGINSAVSGDALQSALGALPVGWTTLPRVYVPVEEEPRTRILIEQIQLQREIDGHDWPSEFWQCQECGETTRVSFEVCWNCNAPIVVNADHGTGEQSERYVGLSASGPETEFDERQTPRWQFNPRAALLVVLIMSFLSAVCWLSLGPRGVVVFIGLTILANIFSGCVGLAVNSLMKESDAKWFGR